MRTLVFLIATGVALGAAGCVPTSIPNAPPPSLDEIAADMGVPGVFTIALREGTLDGSSCELRIYSEDAVPLRFAAVEFPGQRDAELTVTAVGDGPLSVGETVAVRVEGTACAPRLRYGGRSVAGEGRLRILSRDGDRVTGVLHADLRPPGGAAARAGRSVRVLGTFAFGRPASTVSE